VRCGPSFHAIPFAKSAAQIPLPRGTGGEKLPNYIRIRRYLKCLGATASSFLSIEPRKTPQV
jgi:hypothetical protein